MHLAAASTGLASRFTRFAPSTVLFVTLVALGGCGEETPTDTEILVAIAGPDTLRFGALGHVLPLSATVTSSSQPAPTVQWVSNNTLIADVDGSGSLHILRSGDAIIIARAGSARDSVWIEVNQIPVTLSFQQHPGTGAVNLPIVPAVIVTAIDSNGLLVGDPAGQVEVTLGTNPAGAALSGSLSQTIVGGVAAFGNLTLNASGLGFTLSAAAAFGQATSEPFDVLAEPDLIRIANAGGEEVGGWIDGHNRVFVDDLVMLDTDTAFSVVLAQSPISNEIVAFTVARPPAVVFPTAWTANIDTIDVAFRDPIQIAATAWIVIGPFEAGQDRAIAQALTTESIFSSERLGVEFSEFEIIDATADPEAGNFQAVTACNMRTQAEAQIGQQGDRINIYYVGTVDGGRDRGYACAGGDAIFMADRSGFELLAHEIGHSFGLGHVDALSGYDRTNVMHSASSTRAYFTEGQAFRAHYDTFTVLNQVYGAIPPELARSCFDSNADERCPPLIRRLWADGMFPPNYP